MKGGKGSRNSKTITTARSFYSARVGRLLIEVYGVPPASARTKTDMIAEKIMAKEPTIRKV